MKRLVSILCLALLPFLGLHGQGKIEQLYAMYSDQSIIRELGLDKWVVYSNCGGPSFSLVEDANTIVNFIYLPTEFSSVSDFTILDNRVYFCGKLNTTDPVMGYFDLYTFPSTTIHYSKITGVDILTAIKVYDTYLYPPKGTTKHVLMLGRKNKEGILVDAISVTTGGWDTYYIKLLTEGNKTVLHDDIDILGGHVVIASRNSEHFSANDDATLSTGTGYVWYINKPTPPYAPLLTSQDYFPIPNIVAGKELKLAACESKACVVAALAYKNNGDLPSPGIHVYGYEYPTNIASVRIPDDSIDNETLKNLCYDKTMKKTELLLQYNDEDYNGSIIYTLTLSSYPWTWLYGRIYEGHKINSLITRKYSSELFVGSGVDVNDGTGLDLYFYKNTGDTICARGTSRQLSDIDRMPLKTGKKTYENIFHPEFTAVPTEKMTAKYIICE